MVEQYGPLIARLQCVRRALVSELLVDVDVLDAVLRSGFWIELRIRKRIGLARSGCQLDLCFVEVPSR